MLYLFWFSNICTSSLSAFDLVEVTCQLLSLLLFWEPCLPSTQCRRGLVWQWRSLSSTPPGYGQGRFDLDHPRPFPISYNSLHLASILPYQSSGNIYFTLGKILKMAPLLSIIWQSSLVMAILQCLWRLWEKTMSVLPITVHNRRRETNKGNRKMERVVCTINTILPHL